MKPFNSYFSKANVKAYLQESKEAAIKTLIIVIVFSGIYLFFIMKTVNDILILLLLLLFISIISMITENRLGILARIDLKKNNIETCTVRIADFRIEGSWSGRMGNSNVKKFFPKEYNVDTYKLFFIDETGNKKFVRLVMSVKKCTEISDLFLADKTGNIKVKIIEIRFLRRSKILLSFKLTSDIKNCSHVEKQIQRLNNII